MEVAPVKREAKKSSRTLAYKQKKGTVIATVSFLHSSENHVVVG